MGGNEVESHSILLRVLFFCNELNFGDYKIWSLTDVHSRHEINFTSYYTMFSEYLNLLIMKF